MIRLAVAMISGNAVVSAHSHVSSRIDGFLRAHFGDGRIIYGWSIVLFFSFSCVQLKLSIFHRLQILLSTLFIDIPNRLCQT